MQAKKRAWEVAHGAHKNRAKIRRYGQLTGHMPADL